MGQLSNQKFHYLYRHFDKDGNLLYVGISISYFVRLSQHKNGSFWFSDIATSTIEKFNSRHDAEKAEIFAISSEHPLHNVVYNRKKKERIPKPERKILPKIPIAKKDKEADKEKLYSVTMSELGLETEEERLIFNELLDSHSIKVRRNKINDKQFTYDLILQKGIGKLITEEQRQAIRKVHFYQNNIYLEELYRQKEIRQERRIKDQIGSF